MSCNCNSNTVSACGDVNIPVVSAGVKISQLPQTTSAAPNDLFVIVDYSAQKTKNISFYNLIQALNSGANISDVSGVGTYLREYGDWVYFDPNMKLDTSAFYSMSAIDHTTIQNIGIYSHSAIDTHIDDLNIHYPDASSATTFLRTEGLWVPSNVFSSVLYYPITAMDLVLLDKVDTSAMSNYTTTASFESHTSDIDIHYVMSAIDHTVIQNIGTHTHIDIDTHIDDLDIHYPDAVDLSTYIRTSGSWIEFNPNTKFDTSGIGVYATSANLEAHTSNISIHYLMSAIDHTLIENIGVNSHSQIDSHISATNNPHSVTKTQVGLSAVDNTSDLNKPISTATQNALNVKFNTSGINQYTTTASFDSHTSNILIHFPDVTDSNTYLRTSGSWVLYTQQSPLYGVTSARPITPPIGTPYLDTTLGYPIWYLPPNWVNATGATV